MDGHMTYDEFNQALEMGRSACDRIYRIQKDALLKRYAMEGTAEVEEEPAAAQSLEG
jgi:exosome complex component RRP41